MLKLADGVKETTTTTGTGTISLGGAFTAAFQTIVNGIGNGNSTAYRIDDGNGNWEETFGTVTSGTPDTITRGTLISSSTGGRVNFGAGTKTVTIVPAAELFLTAAVSPMLAENSIAAASTCDLSTINTLGTLITGNAAITSFGSQPNSLRMVRFSGTPLLTYDATSLITPTAANIQAAPGDCAILRSDASGNWTIVSYTPAGGTLSSVFSNQAISGSPTHLASVTLTPGKWRLSATCTFNGSYTGAYLTGVISTTIDSSTNSWPASPRIDAPIAAAGIGNLCISDIDITVTSSTIYYLNIAGNGTASAGLNGILRAQRII